MNVILGDTTFQLAVAPDRRVQVATAPLEAPRVNTEASAEDVSNEFGTRFSRSDFSGGEGLRFAHRVLRSDADDRRYFDSQNVEVDADGNVRLLHAPQVSDPTAATGIRLAAAGGSLWATNGTSLRRTDDPQAASPTWVDDSPHTVPATTVADVVGIGTTIYAAVGASINRKTSGGAWTLWHSRSNIERLWTAKGRLYAAVGNELYSYDTGATPTETLELTIAVGQTFNDLCDAGSHVLVTATDGYVHALTDDGTSVVVAGQSFLEGEIPEAITSTFGVVVFGTSTDIPDGGVTGRLYSATLNGAVLEGIQRLRTWDGGSVDRTPLAAAKWGDDVYVAVQEDATTASLWRYDHVNAAVHRSYRYSGAGVVRDVVSQGGRLWWGVDSVGVLRPGTTYESSGWIVSPLADLFTAQEKAWASISLSYSGLTGTGESVTSWFSTGTALDTFRRGERFTQGDRTSESPLTNVTSRYLAVKVVLEPSSDGSVTPTLRAFSTRAYPTSNELLVRFPVNVSDQYERPGRAAVTVPGLGDSILDTLRELEGDATTCEIDDVGEVLRGIVESVERDYTHMTRQGSQSVWAWVTFRGERVSDDVSTGGLPLMGTYFNGLGLMGTSPAMADVEAA